MLRRYVNATSSSSRWLTRHPFDHRYEFYRFESVTWNNKSNKTLVAPSPSALHTMLNKPIAHFIRDNKIIEETCQPAQTPILEQVSNQGIRVVDYINKRFSEVSVPVLDIVLGEQLWDLLPDIITTESLETLLPGNVQRHTTVLPYGILARDEAIEQVKTALGMVERNSIRNTSSESLDEPKENKPLILVVGIARQGKSAFLDNVANNFEGVLTPAGPYVYCINITFNSNWPLEGSSPFQNAAHAFEQFAIRAIAAAAHVNRRNKITSTIITPIVGLKQPNPEELVMMLRSRVLELHRVEPFLLFLADEITNFDCLLPNESAKTVFSAAINDLISRGTAVIQSGFTSPLDAITRSGRPCFNCVLHPLSRPELRRKTSVMATIFFQQIARSFALFASENPSPTGGGNASVDERMRGLLMDTYFYFELLKSSAGLFGAVLERIVSVAAPSLQSVVENIPALKSIDENKIYKCLAWKSIQFCAYERRQHEYCSASVSHEAFFSMLDDCLEAGTSKLAYLPTSRLGWSDKKATGGFPLDSAVLQEPTEKIRQKLVQFAKEEQRSKDSQVVTPLSKISVEPMYVFFNKAEQSYSSSKFYRAFLQFALMLKNYSVAMHSLPYVGVPSSSSSFHNVFRNELERFGLENNRADAELFLRRIVGNRFLSTAEGNSMKKRFVQSAQENEIEIRTDDAGRDTSITAYFFEDAMTVGICAQKSLRASLYENRTTSHVTKLDARVDDFLENCRVFPDRDESSAPLVRWIDKDVTTPTPKSFTGSFPRCTKELCSLSIADFNRETVLRPERPENNALVDVIFHERVAENEEGLIQFWIDAKHRHERHHLVNQLPRDFANLVAEALQNPLLQTTSPSSGKRIIESVVHIIVAPQVKDGHRNAIRDALQAKFSTSSLTVDYFFYFVDPDSIAFENLVSQPIAHAMPLMDQQRSQSWRQRCGLNLADWANYKATLQHHGLSTVITNQKHFREWRQLRLLDDSASTLRSCFSSSQEAEKFIRAISKDMVNAECSAVDNNVTPSAKDIMNLSLLSFGAILEKKGILHNAKHEHDPNLNYLTSNALAVVVSPEDDDVIERDTRLIVGSRKIGDYFALNLESNEFREFMEKKVTIGHLVDGHHEEFSEDNIWNVLFDFNFLEDFKTMLNHVSEQVQMDFADKSVHYVDSYFWKSSTNEIGIKFFNLPVRVWTKCSSNFETHKKSLLSGSTTSDVIFFLDNESKSNENRKLRLREDWAKCFQTPSEFSPKERFNHLNSELCFLLKMMQWQYQQQMQHTTSCSHGIAFVKLMETVHVLVDFKMGKFHHQIRYNNHNTK